MSFQNRLIDSLRNNAMNTAIEYGERKITYSELMQSANSITGFLLKKKLAEETPVGIFLNDRTDFICAMIGILNARCVFVPLDTSLPSERLRAIIKETDLRYLVSSGNEAGISEKGAAEEWYVEDMKDLCNDVAECGLTYPDYNDEDSIYIYFTSGSTGVPKGIVGKNKSLLQFLNWEIETFGINQSTRVSQFISPYFDAFLRDVFTPLLSGGTICIPPAGKDFLIPDRVTEWIDANRISLIHCVPSFFRIFNHDQLTPANYQHLRYVLLSGERIIPAELIKWYDLFGDRIQLVNLYGATESTMIRAFHFIRQEDARAAKIPIGKPISDTMLVILDKSMKPCNPLIPGDLFIVSDFLTKGYLNNPELNEKKFLTIDNDQFISKHTFKTGDKARLLSNGAIELLGREDRQIKLRGIRIELDEIEQVLLQCGFLDNVAIVENKSSNGESFLSAFVISNGVGRDMNVEEAARKYLVAHLPEYMIPSVIEEIDEFPLLSNGKINYKELVNSNRKRIVIAPANDTEEALMNIWKTVLDKSEISTDDSFHSLGGNSISIMKLIGRIYKEFNVRISLEQVFKNPAIKGQANIIRALKKDNLLVIPKMEKQDSYNVSFAQQRVYYNYELNKSRTSYNLPMTWEIKNNFNKAKIEEAFRRLIERHESLRTRFDIEGGRLVQFILDKAELLIEEYHVADTAIHTTIMQFVRPFDLSKAPLFRTALIYTDSGLKILVVDFHHIICDGMSQRILRSDFYKLYYGQYFEPLTIQYKDYAEWEYAYRQTEDYLLHRQFWLHSLEGRLPQLNLPVMNAKTDDISEEGSNIPFEIEKNKLLPLLEYAGAKEFTVSAALFSVYYLFLSQITGQNDLVVGTAASGRIQEELEKLVGMFVKTLPIRYRLDTKASFVSVLGGLHNHLLDALSNQVYDLEDIVGQLNNNKAAKTGKLFNAGFVFLNFTDENEKGQSEDFTTYKFVNMGAKNAVTLYVMEKADSFYFRLEYALSYFNRTDIELLIAQFESLVTRITNNIYAPVNEIIGSSKPAHSFVEDDITFSF